MTGGYKILNLVEQVSEKYPELSVMINNAGQAFAYTHNENAGALKSRPKSLQLIIFHSSGLDIPEPLINEFRNRVQCVPLHFDHAIFLN